MKTNHGRNSFFDTLYIHCSRFTADSKEKILLSAVQRFGGKDERFEESEKDFYLKLLRKIL